MNREELFWAAGFFDGKKKRGPEMSQAPSECLYCDKQGNSKAGGPCGFCEGGVPLDTQEDWDASWGKILDKTAEDWQRLTQEILDRENSNE